MQGSVLEDGFTRGSGVDGRGSSAFTANYTVTERQVGHLEVLAEDSSNGEGFYQAGSCSPQCFSSRRTDRVTASQTLAIAISSDSVRFYGTTSGTGHDPP